MSDNLDNFSDLYKANLESLLNLVRTTLEGAQRLRNVQLGTIEEALAENTKAGAALAGAKDLEELITMHLNLAVGSLEMAINHWRKINEAAVLTQAEFAKVLEAEWPGINGNLLGSMGAAPAGSEPVSALLQSIMSATTSAYDAISTAASQANKMAEANMATAIAGVRQAASAKRKSSSS